MTNGYSTLETSRDEQWQTVQSWLKNLVGFNSAGFLVWESG